MSTRTDRIDTAVSAAGSLITALTEQGPLNGQQMRVLVEAAVRAAVPNAESWEVVASARRIADELEQEKERRGGNNEAVGT
jgi:hypothetical protein